MGSTEQIGLRDKRKPGHCWQDNELYDVYAPIIGPLAICVYVQITRECYGETLKRSLREIAAATGISKETVRRSLGVMELVGMLRTVQRAAGNPGEYELVDLKELAMHHGATFNPKRYSYTLSSAQSDTLRAKVTEYLCLSQGRIVPHRDTSGVENDGSSVPHRAASVPHSDASVPPEGHAIYKQETILNKKPSPTPSTEGVRVLEFKSEPEEKLPRNVGILCVDRAWRECGFSDEKLLPVMQQAIATELKARDSDDPEEIASLMVRRWLEYVDLGEFMRYTWSPKKFIAQGHWLNCAGWPIDRERFERYRSAKVGSYR